MLELVRLGDVSKCSFRFGVEQDEWQYAMNRTVLAMDERTILGFRVWWMCRSWYFPPIPKPKPRCGISKSGKPSICANTHRSRNEVIVLSPKAGREKRFCQMLKVKNAAM